MRRKKLAPLIFIVLTAAIALGACLVTDTSPELGLDLQGGVAVVLEPTEEASDDALDQTIEIIRNRVDALGVAEPEIARQGCSNAGRRQHLHRHTIKCLRDSRWPATTPHIVKDFTVIERAVGGFS